MKKHQCPLLFLIMVLVACNRPAGPLKAPGSSDSIPRFRVDPFWPKVLPENWLLGQVAGVAVDKEDHVWIYQRPRSLGENESFTFPVGTYPYKPAPAVIEFDQEGNVIRTWGEPGEGYEWPAAEHGMLIDQEGYVWINGGGTGNHQVMKFTTAGKFLLAIGKAGETGGNNDTIRLGFPTDYDVDAVAKEIYISDGYVNNRIIVFDSETGKYKRHWGAYGKKPADQYEQQNEGNDHFRTPHSVKVSKDGLVYMADRNNNRIQVFQKNGTFIAELVLAGETKGYGSAWSVCFSEDPLQKYIYLADGTNQQVRIIDRKTLKEVGYFGQMGRYAGEFIWLHSIAVDSKGNIYTGEVYTGKRVQKFNRQ